MHKLQIFGFTAALLFANVGCKAVTASEPSLSTKLSTTPIVFDTPKSVAKWRTINDGVMGGRSKGGLTHTEDFMLFSGVINTNGGGFSSIRTLVPTGTFADVTGVRLRVRSDGRTYKLSFRTGVRYRGRQVAFQAALPVTEANSWTDINIDFSNLESVLFGQPVSSAPFEASDIQEVGFIIADGQDGAFRLDIKSIEVIKTP